MVLLQEDQVQQALVTKHQVVEALDIVAQVVEEVLVKTVSKYQDKTARVFQFKSPGNKGPGNREQSVKSQIPVEVVAALVIMEGVVS